ncbi:succinate dehydrogenase flavoprotein subunit [Paenibacillus pini JCM 16418]|uniref:Succinate dehydrogenase flavoprotein subunit n=1 Tax=Paenibacillus pini JCM 16418 TaxID=1236976 RepID=W7YVM3_9BACL|nr:succinate dehydrogenase flavoprotein subunit [Paenibacillus pini JCM 16418]
MATSNIIIVGGGLAGLMATIKAAEAGVHVHLFSLVPVKRSHSVCAQGGINGAVNTKGEGDSPWLHFDDTVYGGDFLANQPPVKAMCDAAPGIIHLMDRMGVMFSRTPEGLLDFRRFGGTKFHRTAFAGATTGQQLLYALDEQVRRHEAEGLVTKHEHWEFLQAVVDDEAYAAVFVLKICVQWKFTRLQRMLLLWRVVDLVLCSVKLRTPSLIRELQLVRYINKVLIMRMVSLFKFTRLRFQVMTSCA